MSFAASWSERSIGRHTKAKSLGWSMVFSVASSARQAGPLSPSNPVQPTEPIAPFALRSRERGQNAPDPGESDR